MSAEQTTTVTVAVLQSGVLTYVFFHIVRGLKARMAAMEGTIAAQKETLSAMEQRASEAEKIGALYKGLMSDLPKDLENFKTIISHTKDSVIVELKSANDQKDLELKRLKDLEKKYHETPKVDHERRKSLRAVLFLRDMNRRYLGEIFEHFDGGLEATIPVLISTDTFDAAVAKLGAKMKIDDDQRRYKDISDALRRQEKVDGFRILSQSVKGDYVFFSDGRLYLDSARYRHLTEEFLSFRAHISSEG